MALPEARYRSFHIVFEKKPSKVFTKPSALVMHCTYNRGGQGDTIDGKTVTEDFESLGNLLRGDGLCPEFPRQAVMGNDKIEFEIHIPVLGGTSLEGIKIGIASLIAASQPGRVQSNTAGMGM